MIYGPLVPFYYMLEKKYLLATPPLEVRVPSKFKIPGITSGKANLVQIILFIENAERRNFENFH